MTIQLNQKRTTATTTTTIPITYDQQFIRKAQRSAAAKCGVRGIGDGKSGLCHRATFDFKCINEFDISCCGCMQKPRIVRQMTALQFKEMRQLSYPFEWTCNIMVVAKKEDANANILNQLKSCSTTKSKNQKYLKKQYITCNKLRRCKLLCFRCINSIESLTSVHLAATTVLTVAR